MASRFTQSDISKLSGRTVFFDANILMYLFWPTSPTNKTIDYKLFRQSKDGQQTQIDVFDVAKNKILPYFSLTDRILNSAGIKNLLVVDILDFNDKIIFDVCKANNMVLLTNDADFSKSDIDILSANSKLR